MGGILGHLKVGRGYLLQICCTVHIIAILRIYRRSLINKRGELSEGRRKRNLYETSIAIKSQNGCRGNPTLLCSFSHHLHSRLNKMMHSTLKKNNEEIKSWGKKTAPPPGDVPLAAGGGGYVTSMATVFSDRLFSAGLSCSRFSLKRDKGRQRSTVSFQGFKVYLLKWHKHQEKFQLIPEWTFSASHAEYIKVSPQYLVKQTALMINVYGRNTGYNNYFCFYFDLNWSKPSLGSCLSQ